ncbi:MAG: copper ion binding protein [Spirochaetes bacterium]|jgi:copper chaperone|nr:copper ion binding protein [Spirochaetota bacterium]
MEKKEMIKIEGMSCNHCVASIERAVSAVPGVTAVSVDLKKKQAAVSGDFDLDAIRDAVVAAGYTVG